MFSLLEGLGKLGRVKIQTNQTGEIVYGDSTGGLLTIAANELSREATRDLVMARTKKDDDPDKMAYLELRVLHAGTAAALNFQTQQFIQNEEKAARGW